MNDDFNSAITIAQLFEGVRLIYAIDQGLEKITKEDLATFVGLLNTFTFNILGLKEEIEDVSPRLAEVMNILIEVRNEARKNKNYALSDAIRDRLAQHKILLKDTPEGTRWQFGVNE